jgi:hypothetical protein
MRTAKRPIQLLCFFYVEVMNNEDRVNGLVILKWFSKIARSEELVTIQSRLLEIHLGDSDSPVWTVARK